MTYQGHALDEITLDGTFKQARDAAAMARVTGSIGTTERTERRMADGSLQMVEEVSVEAIDSIEARNRPYHVRSWGPAYRVKGLDVVIVLASRPGRYKSHAA